MVKEKEGHHYYASYSVCHMHLSLSAYCMPNTVQGGSANEQDKQSLSLVGFKASGVTGYFRRVCCEY